MLTTPTPLKTYTPPNLPTLEQTRNDHDFLKKMPLRWRKCAAVCTAVGLMGSLVLTGCWERISSLNHSTHYGGGGFLPYYVVYLTEQEALDVIRTQLEKSGLKLDDELPNLVGGNGKGIDLFDSERGIAIVYSDEWYGDWDKDVIDELIEDFEQQDDTLIFKAFYTHPEMTSVCELCKHTEQEKAQAREEKLPILQEQLIQQTDEFVELLKEQGIL